MAKNTSQNSRFNEVIDVILCHHVSPTLPYLWAFCSTYSAWIPPCGWEIFCFCALPLQMANAGCNLQLPRIHLCYHGILLGITCLEMLKPLIDSVSQGMWGPVTLFRRLGWVTLSSNTMTLDVKASNTIVNGMLLASTSRVMVMKDKTLSHQVLGIVLICLFRQRDKQKEQWSIDLLLKQEMSRACLPTSGRSHHLDGEWVYRCYWFAEKTPCSPWPPKRGISAFG